MNTPDAIEAERKPSEREQRLLDAARVIADYADPTGKLPSEFIVTMGSPFSSRRQLCMGDFYALVRALSAYKE